MTDEEHAVFRFRSDGRMSHTFVEPWRIKARSRRCLFSPGTPSDSRRRASAGPVPLRLPRP